MDMTYAVISILVLTCHVTGSDVAQRATDPVAHVTSVTDHLTAQLHNLTNRVNHLEDQLTVKNEVISNLTKELKNRGHQLDTLDDYCHSNVDTLDHRVDTLEAPVSFVVHFQNDSVGTNRLHHISSGYSRLLFDVIQFQNGGPNYNTSTGYFTVPSSGTYAFFLTIQRSEMDANVCVEAQIIWRVNRIISMASACPDGYTTASNMGITHLNAGDRVWVKSRSGAHMFGYIHTTFSGFKLTPH